MKGLVGYRVLLELSNRGCFESNPRRTSTTVISCNTAVANRTPVHERLAGDELLSSPPPTSTVHLRQSGWHFAQTKPPRTEASKSQSTFCQSQHEQICFRMAAYEDCIILLPGDGKDD